MLLWVCSLTDHRWCQRRSSWVFHLCSYHNLWFIAEKIHNNLELMFHIIGRKMLLIIRLSIYLNPPMEEPVKILIKFSLLENYGVRRYYVPLSQREFQRKPLCPTTYKYIVKHNPPRTFCIPFLYLNAPKIRFLSYMTEMGQSQ